MNRLRALSPEEQNTTLRFIKELGVQKQSRSLPPVKVAQLLPEQLISTKLLEREIIENPENDTPERTILLAEWSVRLGNKYVCWYALLQLSATPATNQFAALFNHYDFAQTAYHNCAFGRPKYVRKRKGAQADADAEERNALARLPVKGSAKVLDSLTLLQESPLTELI